MKQCSTCMEIKKKEEFHSCKTSKDGLQWKCKECDKAWKRNNKDKTTQYRKAWLSKNPGKELAMKKAWQERNYEHWKSTRRAWHAKNRDRLSERNKARYAENPEKNRLQCRAWARANADKVNKRTSAWKRANPEKRSFHEGRRRASKFKATPLWADKFIISEIYHLARIRTLATSAKWHVDHIVPLKSKIVCGLHCESNLQVIPHKANISKGNSWWPDMPEEGFESGL